MRWQTRLRYLNLRIWVYSKQILATAAIIAVGALGSVAVGWFQIVSSGVQAEAQEASQLASFIQQSSQSTIETIHHGSEDSTSSHADSTASVLFASESAWVVDAVAEELYIEVQTFDYILPAGALSPAAGAIFFEGHRETYYNLDMWMFEPYSIRADGAKVKPNGDIILACHTKYRGTRRLTSLGWGICLDTGGFALREPEMVDVATNW
jgi:hypothetical protein